MIVKHNTAGWQVIYHYAHGLLAGQLAQRLDAALRPTHWTETLTAVIEHDDQQLDFDEKVYRDAQGAPRDFTQEERSATYRLDHAQRVVTAALRKSGYVALLISMHLDFLYGDLADEHADFAGFLAEQKELRKQLRRRYGLNLAKAKAAYDILLFCDRCSLILCQDAVPSVGRKLEVNRTINDQTYFIWQGETALHIHPWCFADDRFEVTVEERQLDQLTYASDAALRDALAVAPVRLRTWILARP